MRLAHTATTLDVILAHYAVTFVDSLLTLQTADATRSVSTECVRWIVRVENVDSVTGIFLGFLV